MTERVIFLDVDGVLNTARSRTLGEGRWRDLDPQAVARLDQILERGRATVVLSSAWRKAVDPQEVQARLAENGFRGTVRDRIPLREEHDPAVLERLGETKVARAGGAWPRGYEIQQWLDAHPKVAGIVILDEGHDMKHLQPWLVETNHISGLRDIHVERALAILLGPPPPRSR
ncbi:HAD domain-containing protein [Paraliomyxa miuraensis]|uniref:HAD domain-containing protein n=1 Tax=Paraliomyxa miuraensis TaxID=376150 RepID=UPI002254FA1D|nr:HAD domain-containing protein [Paraliomyxa miuraensis]MCX4245035.1 HAD domain-containing protein [Paraliomyxa miuraensis]